MIVKKSGGKVIGAHLTNAEKKAMDIEIMKDIAEFDRKNEMEIDAMIIWHVRRFSGYGKGKLKRFFLDFVPMYNEMCERYELGATDNLWLYTKMLKDEGIDIEEWYKEIKE